MRIAASLFCVIGAATAAGQPQEIGSWRVACVADRMTDRTTCLLRHRDWVEPPAAGQPGLALEVIAREGRLVPAVTSRDLGLEQAARGLLALSGTAQLRFPPNRLIEAPCGLEGRSLVCAPRGEEAVRAEAELAQAPRVLVRLVGRGGGDGAEPAELPLAGTAEALARLRREAPPAAASAEPPPGLDARDLLNRLQRLLGY